MKRFPFLLAACFLPVSAARSAIVYSGYQNIAVPQTFEGLYLNPVTGATATSLPGDWNTAPWINPFFGGVGIANSALLRPVVTGGDQVVNLAPGTAVTSGSTFAAGESGSAAHVGAAGNQFTPGTPGNLGYQFQAASGGASQQGWLNITISNIVAGVIRDWAYDNAGGSITVGRVEQSAPAAGTQIYTLSPGAGEIFTLASAITDTGGNLNRLVKTGAGTATLGTSGINTYTGSTLINGGTLLLGASSVLPSATAVELAGGTLHAGGTGNAVGTLLLSSPSVIDMAGAGSSLSFADSRGVSGWAGTLAIWNWTPGLDLLRFGTDGNGLTAGQLGMFSVYEGAGSGQSWGATLDSNGYLVPVPEPGAVLAALLLLGGIGWRERHTFLRIRRVG